MEGPMKARISDLLRPETTGEAYDFALFLKILLWTTGFKLLLAVIVPLSVDEAYAIAVARVFSISFFDHPPISFWLPVLAAKLTGIEAPIVYRLPFVIAGIGTAWMMYLTGRLIGGSRVGVWTAVLFLAAPFFMLSAGVYAVPDGPLSFASAVSVYFLVRIAQAGTKPPVRLWVCTGLALAFALASKYQAAWIPVAVVIYMVLSPKARRWFLQPGPYIGGLIGLLGLLPVVLWNVEHDWASFQFHTGRVNGVLNPLNFLVALIGQAVYLLPVTLVVAVLAIARVLRQRRGDERLLLALIAVGPIVFFNYVYLTSAATHPHWPFPGWLFALPLAAVWLCDADGTGLRRYARWGLGLLALFWALTGLLILQATTGVLTRPFYDQPPVWDNTFQMFSYDGLLPELKSRGLWDQTDLLMSDGWAEGGLMDTAVQGQKPMRIAARTSAHHFAFMPGATATGTALYLMPSLLRDADRVTARSLENARRLDPAATVLPPILLTRGGIAYVSVSVIRLKIR